MRYLNRFIMGKSVAMDAFDEDLEDAFNSLLEDSVDAAINRHKAVRPGTKCTEREHGSYYGRVRSACKHVGPYNCNKDTDTIDQLFAKSAIAGACATARQAYQRRCFDRTHPKWQGHEIARNQAERTSRKCWELGKEKQDLEVKKRNQAVAAHRFDYVDDFNVDFATPSSKKRQRTSTRPFLRSTLRQISNPHHPLHFLVVARRLPNGQVTYDWRKTTRTTARGRQQTGRYEGNEHGPVIQVGHQGAFAAGVPERLMLEDADLNQQTGRTIESKGAYSFKDAVMIGGVPVDVASAQQWERLGLLNRGTVAQSPKISSPMP